jgi:glycosyltransferase involved in cell wall biosynthesis
MAAYSLVNIVLPVYNEKDNITNTLLEIETRIHTPHHVFVIYDFDEDNTLPVVKKYTNNNKNVDISLVKNKYGGGVLNAIKTGFECVNDGVILVMMADLSDDLGKVDEMFAKVNEGYDIICGSRYSKGGGQIGGPRLKKLLSRIAGISLHYLIGIPTRDISNSFKIYTKKVINDITIESDGGFEIGMEIVLKAFCKGYRITEVPSIWRGRVAGGSRFRLFKWLPKYLRWYWYGVKNRFSKRFIKTT